MKDFKVAEIVPVAQLEDTRNNCYHMCLAHLVATNGLMAQKYTAFYRKMSDEGKYVLLDNGAAESSQLGFNVLLEQVEKVHPTEIVIPDTLSDAKSTLAKMFKWLDIYGDLPYKFMAVPQGKDLEEWKACAYIMMQEKRINTIGISKFLTITTGDKVARYKAVQYLDRIVDKLGRYDIEYHLLGCHEGPNMVRGIHKLSARVRGCDSAFAYIASKAGVVINKSTKRPAGVEINFLGDGKLQEFGWNSKKFESACGVQNNCDGKEWQ